MYEFRFSFVQIIFIVYVIEVYVCIAYAGDEEKKQEKKTVKKTVIQINLIDELHSLYKDAIENDKRHVTRRFSGKDGHTQYSLHVQKLKEVNGVKTHNLRAEGRSRNQDPIIYINNPVEAGLPNPFLSIEEFKKAMVERIQNQKKEFGVQNYPAYKPFKAKNFDNVKKLKKPEVEVRTNTEFTTKPSSDKLIKKSTHKGNHKVNKKRKPKHYFSRATKSTTKPRIKTRTVTKTVANKNKINPTTQTKDHKVNKKRKPKHHFSRATKSTRKPRKKTTTTLSDEFVVLKKTKTVTETVANKNIINPTTKTRDHKVNKKRKPKHYVSRATMSTTKPSIKTTTETVANKNIINPTRDHKVSKKRKPKHYFSRANKSTTKPRKKTTTLSDELVIFQKNETITETVAKKTRKNSTTESSVDEKIKSKATADGVTTTSTITVKNTTTESTASDVITTTTAAIDDITTETTVDEITTTEMVTNEVTTEPVAIVSTDATTEQTTAKTKRTRQAKPYVFMGY